MNWQSLAMAVRTVRTCGAAADVISCLFGHLAVVSTVKAAVIFLVERGW